MKTKETEIIEFEIDLEEVRKILIDVQENGTISWEEIKKQIDS